MNGTTKQWTATAAIALVVGAGGSMAALKTLGEAAGLATEPVVRQMISDLCPYTADRNSLSVAIASLQEAVEENTEAMGEVKTAVAVLIERTSGGN